MIVQYEDGLRAFLLEVNGAVGTGPRPGVTEKNRKIESTRFWTQEARPAAHFTLMLHGIEDDAHRQACLARRANAPDQRRRSTPCSSRTPRGELGSIPLICIFPTVPSGDGGNLLPRQTAGPGMNSRRAACYRTGGMRSSVNG